ncbi:MAG: helix-turn-helix domain-containing protein [Bacteroidales bacterium]|nr:helix-turn-helix domain-containing protein [Bacteroidales bacterium]
MDNLQSSLQNALELANIDFEVIFDFINNDRAIEEYRNNAKKLGTDFERELSLMVLQSTPEQIKTFANLNICKIDLAIKQINITKEYYSKSKSQINNDLYSKEMFDDIINPILEIHFAELTYIKRLLLFTFDNPNKTPTKDVEPTISIKETKCDEEESTNPNDSLLSEFGEFLSMKDMEKIFNVKRNSIYRWEKEGRIKRFTRSKKKVLFKKEEILTLFRDNKN